MTTAQTLTAEQAIAQSIRQTEIVSVPYSRAIDSALNAASEDSANANDGVIEYWGGKGDGAWRVHVLPETVYCHGCGNDTSSSDATYHDGEPYCPGCEAAPAEEE